MATARKTTSKKVTATKVPAKKTGRRVKLVDLSVTPAGIAPFVNPIIMTSTLDLTDEEDHTVELTSAMREGLDGITQRAKTKQVSFLTPAQMVKTIIPIDELPLQRALGSVGLRSGTLFELIAPEHVGKTTLIANWLGKFAMQGCQSLYIECEGKQMDPNRFLRCMHPNRRIAKRVFGLVTFTKARTLSQAEHNANVWVAEARKRSDADPRFAGKPLIVVCDPWGKLKSEAEAEGRSTFGKNAQQMAKAVKKETGKASNLGHAKYAHAWARALPEWLEENNVLLIIVQHQNEHIDMGSYSPVTVSDSKNDTVIGGKAFAQLAAYRATLTNAGQWSVSKNVVGLKTRLMFIKNSYGPKYRTADIRLKFEHHEDTETHFDPVTYYSYGAVSWMASENVLNTKVSDGLFTCDTIGCVAVDEDTFYTALKQRPDVVSFIGTAFKIEGYAHIPLRTEALPDEEPPEVEAPSIPPPPDDAHAEVTISEPPPPPVENAISITSPTEGVE